MSVVDTNVLSALAKVERLDLLPAVFDEVATVSSVVEELDTVRLEGYEFVERIDDARSEWLDVVSPSTSELERAEELRDETLSFVDAACLSVCDAREARLVTDDGHLLHRSRQLDVPVVDLATLLQAAIRRDAIQSDDELDALIVRLEERDSYRFATEDERRLRDEFA